MKRKGMVALCMLVLGMVLLFAMTVAASAEGYSDGNGTENDPYLIASREDFQRIADAVNGGDELYGVYFKQTADIDMGGAGNPWPVVGVTIDNGAHQFRGVFDGDNHQVLNLYVNRKDDDAGLFGYVGQDGVVRNVHVVDGDISGTYWCGGVASRNYGLIEYCSFSGYVYGSQQFVGGIVGDNHSGGIIRYCYNTGDVDGEQICGGIAGRNSSSTVENCYNRGDVYVRNIVRGYGGGVVGENTASSTIDNCYSTGSVEGSLACGAIAGANGEGSTVQACYYPDDLEPGLGSSTGTVENVQPKTEEEFESGEVAWELSKGTDGDGWGQNIAEGETHDIHPHFTQAPDKEYDTTEVYRVTFHSTNPPVDQKFYVDPGVDVELPWLPENAKWYVNGEEFNGLNILCDVDAIAGLRILFAGETETVKVTGIYNPLAQTLPVNLDQYMQYADNGPSADGRFEYRIINDSDNLQATLSNDGRMLTIPAGTSVNGTGYTLTIEAHEKEPYIMPLSMGDFGTKDVVLNVKIVIEKATPLIVVKPTASEISYGKTLGESALSGGKAQHPAAGVDVPGVFAWETAGTIPTVPEAAGVGYAVTFTPSDTQNYNDATALVTLTVNKVDPEIVKAPEPQNGTYSGLAQQLIEPGSAVNGTMVYSLEKDGEYLPDSPARANADTYTVWYKVVGDENHNDLGPDSVVATISPYPVIIQPDAVTYNGAQSFTMTLDGVNGEIVVATLTAYSKDAGTYEYAASAEEGKYTVELSSSNYAVNEGSGLTISQLQAVLVWSHPLVFVYDDEEHKVTATVSNAVKGDVISLLYDQDNQNITNSASAAGHYMATVKDLGNNNYTLEGVRNISQPWHIIERDNHFGLSAKPSDKVTYGEEVELTFKIALDESKAGSNGQVRFAVNGESIGEVVEVTFSDGTAEATISISVKVTSANAFSVGANMVTAEYDDADGEPLGIDAISVEVIPKTIEAEITGNTTKTYDGNEMAADLDLKLDGVEECDDGKVTVAADSFTYNSRNVSEATTITANQAMLSGALSGNYALETPVMVDGNITAKVVRLEWSGYDGLVYTGNAANVTATATQLIPGDVCTVEVADGQKSDAGDYMAAAIGLSNTNYVLPENPTQAYTIEPAALYIPELTVTYNGEKALTVDNVPTGVKNDQISVRLEASAADVGRYAYAAEAPSYTASIANANYVVAGGGILHITPATPDVVWPSVNKTVYVNDPSLTLSDLNGGSATGVNGVSLKGDFIMEQGALGSWAASGSQLFQVVFKPESANYTDVTGSLLIQVDKRAVASVESFAAITDKQFGTALEDLGLPATVTITTADGKTFERVPVMWSGYRPNTLAEQILTGILDLRDIAQEVENPQNLTASIAVRLLWFNGETVDFPDKAVTYFGAPASHGIDSRITGVAGISYVYEGKDGTTYGPSSSAPINAGTYAVTATFTMGSGYPQIDAMTATLTVNQAPLFVPELVVTYDGTTRFVMQNVPTGINDETVTFILVTTYADVGQYTYGSGDWTYAASMADPNYIIVGGKLLTIIAPEVQTGGVTVRKEVTGKGGDTQAAFAFKVTLSDSSLSGAYGDMVFINGMATFALKHGESKTATGLPAGVRYSVIEQTANQDGYATTAMGESGAIAEGTTETAVFVNARDAADVPQTGDDSRIEWWLALMSVSLMVLLVSGFGWMRRKQK